MLSSLLTSVPVERIKSTREGLHAVAEWLLAGPQFVRQGTIRLSVESGSVVTKDRQTTLTPTRLTHGDDGDVVRAPLQGTLRELGDAVGIAPSVPEDLYKDHSALGLDDALIIDTETAAALIGWFEEGVTALRAFAPIQEPVLWPEHFDVGVAQDEVNFGISLGDASHDQPYAYVGPWQRRSGVFWNAPFGAARSAAEFSDAESLAAFFRDGARLAVSDPPAASR